MAKVCAVCLVFFSFVEFSCCYFINMFVLLVLLLLLVQLTIIYFNMHMGPDTLNIYPMSPHIYIYIWYNLI